MSCLFCKKILRSPIKQCPICQKMACKLCLDQQNSDGLYCLFSKECQLEIQPNITNEQLLEIYRDIDESDPLSDWILLIQLDQLIIKCPFSFNSKPEEQCQAASIKHKLYDQHVQDCRFKLYQCNNAPCDAKYIFKNKNLHLQECKYIKINCQWCGDEDYKILIMNHLQKGCTYKKQCEQCSEFYSSLKREEHLTICPLQMIKCQGCSKDMYRKEYENQHFNSCYDIEIICKCGSRIKRKHLKEHTNILCIQSCTKNINLAFLDFESKGNEIIDFLSAQLEETIESLDQVRMSDYQQSTFKAVQKKDESWIQTIHSQMSKYGLLSDDSSFEERDIGTIDIETNNSVIKL